MSGARIHTFRTDWGWCGLAATPAGLRRAIIPSDTAREKITLALAHEFPDAKKNSRPGNDALIKKSIEMLRGYFSGEATEADLPINLDGLTIFQRKVLCATKNIPYGKTRTYSQIATAAGSPRAARAVGSALGRNPLPIIVPCHRVVAASNLGGFSAPGGLSLKRKLLTLEQQIRPIAAH